ncbi:DUF3042 family protein [Enterococcus timonensis]|uniref:DUF3042 family protein n=1 Tax=Enterococcus timonensis TaxID=1852364 RepID=UPI0008D94622|nr:DUF3042 family protein [Enterococcus timonensis]
MKKFFVGVLVGSAITVGTAAAFAYCVKKNVIAPLEEKEDILYDKRQKAHRKSFAR